MSGEAPSREGGRTRRRLRIGCGACAVLLCLLWAAERWVVTPYRVVGVSMEPTLEGEGAGSAGDVILVDRLSYVLRDPRRWEVVVFSGAGRDDSVKRIVGLPGETVEVRDASIWIDGSRCAPPPGLEGSPVVSKGPFGHGPLRLGRDEYFVLGDNSYLSRDSRARGPVPRSSIVGRAVLVLVPLRRFGTIR